MLLHVRSGQFVHLSSNTFDGSTMQEINLHNQQTSWTISHFAPFVPQTEHLLKGGDVVQMWHLEVGGHLRYDMVPRFKLPQNQGNKKFHGNVIRYSLHINSFYQSAFCCNEKKHQIILYPLSDRIRDGSK